MRYPLLLAIMTGLVVGSAAQAAPGLIHYQARLADSEGMPLAGPVDAVFRLYVSEESVEPLWEETHGQVPLAEGRLSVLLGSVTPLPQNLTAAGALWLEITVEEDVLSPRLQLASVPFALDAERLGGMEPSDYEAAGAADTLRQDLLNPDGTPVNEGGAVHWDNLLGVPSGFADGLDDGGAATDHGSLSGLEDDDHPQYLLRTDQVDGLAVKDSSLTEADVAPGSLTGQSVATGSLTGDHIALESLTGDHIQDDSIWSADILDKSVTANDIQDGAVGSAQLAADAVTGDKIADATIEPNHVNFSVGDIEAVLPGPGLSGGGESGTVQLMVGEGTGIDVQGQSVGLAPSYVSGSAYDSRFVTRSNPTFNSVSAAASVSGAVFRPTSNTGKFTSHANGYIYVDSDDNVGAEDRFTAPIQLPHGGTITGFFVTYWDNSTASMDVGLWRASQDGSSAIKIAGITSNGQTAAWVTGQDGTISQASIDNLEFVYWVDIDFPSTPQGNTLRVLSAQVQYSITTPN